MKNFRLIPFGLWVVLLAACSSNTPGECTVNSDCGSGAICDDDSCSELCRTQKDCPSDKICTAGGSCVDPDSVPGEKPEIVDITGNDPIDPGVVLDGIVVDGLRLDNASFQLEPSGGGSSIPLGIHVQSATQVELVLPVDIVADIYTLVATNSAGSDSHSVQLLLVLDGEQILDRLDDVVSNRKLLLSLLPTGTTFGTVALGDHNHDGVYITAAEAIALVGQPPDCQGRYMGLQYSAGAGWTCVDLLATGPSFGEAKAYEAFDSWGYVWDGEERRPGTWAAANQYCQDRGGRLPTISELWRAGGGWKGEIGNAYASNYLWSRTWWSKTAKAKVRMTDGAITAAVVTGSAAYRCVWPNNNNTFFAGNHCMGEPGDECWDHVAFPVGKMHMDKYERPAVSYVAATDECSFYGAHLGNQLDYAENALSSLPNGSDNWNWTADHHRYDINSIVKWLGVDTTYDDWAPPHQTWASRTGGPYRFRCVGVGYAAGAHPTAIANEFVTSTHIKGIEASTAKASFGDSIDGCFKQGGHIAHSRDIMELVRAGMGSGPGTGADYIWLADRSRYDITQIGRWGGIDPMYTSYHGEYVTWATVNTTTLYEHRCAFYPIDTGYTAPADVDCTSGVPCTTFVNGATEWAVDTRERPSDNYPSAVLDCLSRGARLPSAHQLTEAIRAGLPNGSQLWLWTSDSSGSDANGYSYSTILKWNGTDTAFSPIHSTVASWSGKGATTRNYRCLWSNELW